jgi:endo-1,4-beta-xylanase
MTDVSRRDCMGLLATSLLLTEGAEAASRRTRQHGATPPRHHQIFEPAGTGPDCLNALAMAKGLAFGTCLGTAARRPPSLRGAVVPAPTQPVLAGFDDPAYRALAVSQCGLLVPENELKWYALRPTPHGFDFSRADQLIGFASRYRFAMRGHTLLWNRSRWMPAWLAGHDFGPRPAIAAETMLRDHIKTVCRRYGDRIFSYDVVNETIAPATGEMEESPFTRLLGPEVVDLTFRLAREAAPEAQLVYNDYMGWSSKDATHRAGVLKLLERLKRADVPIDALGIQAHLATNGVAAGTPLGDADIAEWRKFLDAVTALGLDLVITEFDVDDRAITGTPAERDRVVADYAKAYLDVVLSYRQTRYVLAWGLADKYSWLQQYTPRPDGTPKRCLPYDDKYQPKPLRTAIVQALAAAPSRPALPMPPA